MMVQYQNSDKYSRSMKLLALLMVICYYKKGMHSPNRIIVFLLCFCVVSCGNKTSLETSVSVVEEEVCSVQSWQKTDDRVAVVFGYGYTGEPFYSTVLSSLEASFGLDSSGGLILPLSFPDDFNYEGNTGRISSLPDILAGKNVKALIVLGAPESTHRALALIQDKALEDSSFAFPVFSLFPQDDILGIEAGSSVVINFAPFGNAQGLGEESGLQHMDLIPYILTQLIKNIREFTPGVSSSRIQRFLNSALGSAWQVDVNIDPETSLRSKNHFLLSLLEVPLTDESLVNGLMLLSK